MSKLKWSEDFPPNSYCSYNHCFADTPFGRFLLTWKGWKEHCNSGVGFDETPFADEVWYDSWDSVEDAKKAAEERFFTEIHLLIQGKQH